MQLIFSGRVLKNEDLLTKYGVKSGVAIHLVRPSALSSPGVGPRELLEHCSQIHAQSDS